MLLRFALLLTVFFTLLIVLFRQPGYDPVPAITPCDDFCWQGLQMDTTRREQALTVMNRLNGALPRFAVCYDQGAQICELYRWEDEAGASNIEIRQGKLAMLTFVHPPRLTLGDLLLALRRLDQPPDASVTVDFYGGVYVKIAYPDASLTLELDVTCPTGYRTLLQAPVRFLGIAAPDAATADRSPVEPFRVVRDTLYRQCGG